ncbi:MAG: alpha-2-macroglobulin family protein [Minicystis sp.]
MSRPAALLALFVAAIALGCPEVQTAPVTPPAPPTTPPVTWRVSKNGLGFRLSDADARDDHPAPRAPATTLSEADAKRVLDRLPALPADSLEQQPFALRDRSQPPPRPGKTVAEPFPPPPSSASPPVPPASGPLVIARKAPVGVIEVAPFLSVSFSAPMVAVTSIDDLARTRPPIVITPEPPGKWRWVGAQTAVFDPDKRFPMATEYTVKVPAGTRAANGQALAQDETWTFATPPPKLVSHHANGRVIGLDPVLYAEFDQAVDREALLQAVRVRSPSGPVEVRAATEDEIAADAVVRRLSDKAQPGRWIAMKPKAPLARATRYEVAFPAGTPSAEGPRRTEKMQRFEFETYAPLHAWRLLCGGGHCVPGAPLRYQFNNPIDPDKFDRSWVRVSPEPEGMRVAVSGSSIEIRGRTRGKSKYTVTVSGALADTLGQTLGQDVSAEVTVGTADAQLFAEERDMSVLDPGGAPALPVFSVNRPSLNVRLYAVGPEDWPKYEAWREAWDLGQKIGAPPGRLVTSRAITPANLSDELVITPVDLTPALKDGVGQVLVIVEPPGPPPKERWQKQWVRTWVQVTRLGIETFTDHDTMVAWTTRLADGAPEAGVEVAVVPFAGDEQRASGISGADGLLRFALPVTRRAIAVARKGSDLAIVPHRYGEGFSRHSPADEIRWLVFDDRGTYKPGEEVHIKGWLRRLGGGRGGDVGAVPGVAGKTIAWSSNDSRGQPIATGKATADASGGFDLAFTLPATANLGQANVRLTIEGTSGLAGTTSVYAVSVQEFRRPEFEVGARAEEGPHFVGGHTNVTASATYYAGGGLPNAEVAWQVWREDARFVPPNRGAYAFGKSHDPWWIERRSAKGNAIETWTGHTSASGEHRLRVDFDAVEPSYPMTLHCNANITDVNRQAWSAEATLLVHPADVYVGVKQDRAFVKAGESLVVDLIAADIDGNAVLGRAVTVKSARLEWAYRGGEWSEIEADADGCAVTSAREAVRCALKTKEGGRYRVTAIVTDAHGRRNQTETHAWVMGAGAREDRGLPQDQVQIIPSKESFGGGETAEMLLVAPFAPAEGVIAIERQGVVHVERFQLAAKTQTVRVNVDRAWAPNVTAHVVLLGAAVREGAHGEPDPALPRRPAFASGTVEIKVPPRDRALAVTVKPRDAKLDPGGSTEVDVEVRDAVGAAVAGGTVAVIVADEAVLALSEYATPDPLAWFHPERDPGTSQGGNVEHVLLARAEDKVLAGKAPVVDRGSSAIGGELGHLSIEQLGARAMATAAPMAPPEAPEKARAAKQTSLVTEATIVDPTPIKVRSDLAALALFAPALPTDASGHARVAVKLPESLTRYRVMAVAVAGEKQFGSGEASITARLPLMVRPSAPRFLNYGDRFDLPIVVQNQTDAPLVVDVAARAANASLTAGAGRRVTVPANDRVEVLLPAAAAKPGRARFQIGAVSGRHADAAEVSLPVWTPATTEAFATYGVVDEGAIAQPVKMPSGVEPSFGGIEITTSSTALSTLGDAVLYLVRYPFECNEQIASRVLAVAALRDVLSAFAAKDLPPKEVLVASMARDIEKLGARQHDTGGWGFWQSDREPWPFLSIHVAHALQRAKEKGFEVPQHTLYRAQLHLRGIEHRIPAFYSAESRRALVAYALYVRKRMGDPDPARARKLVEEAGGIDKLPLEAVGWIWPTLAEAKADALVGEIRRVVQNRASETAGAAHFTASYSDGAYVLLHSERRADGVLLETLIGDQPQSDLIPKLVTGLLAHRKAGRWQSTQENAFVLLALDRYFAAYEKQTPDFVARAWLGDRSAGEHAYKGRGGERHQIEIPMRALADVGSGDVVVEKKGTGRLYYRVGMTYAPSDLRPPPVERGFSVSRTYEAVDDPGDVRRGPDGVWHVKAGAKVRVRLGLVAPARRYHVALVDSLPAGLEPMNAALAVTAPIPHDPKADPGAGWWWRATWYEHQNMRDERVEAFASLLWEGVYDYTYVARATTPGTFVAPPPKAEEMYSPETFGRGAGDRLIVE